MRAYVKTASNVKNKQKTNKYAKPNPAGFKEDVLGLMPFNSKLKSGSDRAQEMVVGWGLLTIGLPIHKISILYLLMAASWYKKESFVKL